jgi:capsular polysaccharide transport system permease protein
MSVLENSSAYLSKHGRIISALLGRELATRYGRGNIGFLWIIGEPLLFSTGVLFLWHFIRPPYEHGLKLMPFLMTGYFPMLIIRHMMGHGMHTIAANSNLLYHKVITLLHLFIARCLLEFFGVSFAFLVVVTICLISGLVEVPKDMMFVYEGWFLLAWVSFGIALVFGSIAAVFEDFEKIGNLLGYVIIPIAGTYYMVGWLPYQYRELALKIPFVNCIEMVRRGFFGESVPTYFHVPYTVAFAAVLTFVGLMMLRYVRGRIEVE